MAILLNDVELRKLLGTVIQDGDAESIRPNSYVLRLGPMGEFLNTGKEFELGDKKKGIRIAPGHSVAVTGLETIDFRLDTVRKVFPESDLHGIVSPTTDLSREGIVAPTTQIDAGFFGTLNWTLTNTSSEERRFVHKERIFRLAIFRLEKDERPESLYGGTYQSRIGYVRSQRRGAPTGMKEVEWEDGQAKGSPEDLLDNLVKSGYPWHALGQRLMLIDQQFKSVTLEYADLREAIERLTADLSAVRERQAGISDTVRAVLREEANALQNRWLLGSGSLLFAALGAGVSILASDAARGFVTQYGVIVGLAIVLLSLVSLGSLFLQSRLRR
ncbi:MAG: hypothetical protein AB1806_00455 [Acidobacteriota bacterium]